MAFLGNKRGWEHGVIVTLLVVLASTIVVFFVYDLFWKGVNEAGKDLVCENAIKFAANTKRYPSFDSPVGVGKPYISAAKACPRNQIIFRYDDVVDNGLIIQEKAHTMLADAAYRCWKKVGAGKIDPFSDWGYDGESYCLICGVVSFDDKLKQFMRTHAKEKDFGITSPVYYLMTHEVPDPKMKGVSYWEYFYNKKLALTQEDLRKVQQNKQLVQEGLAVVVSMYKPDVRSEFLNKAGQYGGLGAVVVGAGTLATIATGGLLLIPIVGAGTLLAGGIAGGALLVGGGLISYGSFTSAFSECKECKGIGALSLLFTEEAFTKEYEVTVGGSTEMVKLCTKPVN